VLLIWGVLLVAVLPAAELLAAVLQAAEGGGWGVGCCLGGECIIFVVGGACIVRVRWG
jgi:hypothetical protein